MKKINIEKTLMIIISVTAYISLCLFSPMEMPDGDKKTIMAVLCKYNKSELIGYGAFYSIGTVLNCFRDMQWYVVILPVIVSLYPVIIMREKFFSPSYYYQVTRVGRKCYSRINLIESAGYVIAVNNLSLILFFIIICMKFPWTEIIDGAEITGSIDIMPMAKICLTTTLVALLLLCITLYFFGNFEYIGRCIFCNNTSDVDMLHRL